VHEFDVLAHQGDDDGSETFIFEEMGQPAHGARTGGSHRCENYRIDAKREHRPTQFTGLVLEHSHRGGAHERIVSVGSPGYAPITLEFPQPCSRQHDIDILLEAAAIEIRRDMAAEYIAIPDAGRKRAVSGIVWRQWPFTADNQAGRRHDGDVALVCSGRCSEWCLWETRAVEISNGAALWFRYIG
jgi:hypothetical protein